MYQCSFPALSLSFFILSVIDLYVYHDVHTYDAYIYIIYLEKDRNGKRLQWKKSMRINSTVYSKTA